MLKKLIFPTIFILLSAIFLYCDGNGPGPSGKPVISDIQLSSSIHYADSQTVSALVSDPQGLGDIDSVWGNYLVPGNTGSVRYIRFHDDGTGGDASPGDGRFTSRFLPSSGFLLEDYVVNISAADLEGNNADMVEASFSVVDTSTPLNPVLSDVELEFYHFYRDSQTVSVLVSDPNGPQDIDSVWGQYYFDEASPAYTHILFNDDGINGDLTPGDNRYTAAFLPDSGAFIQGNYRVDIRAADSSGLQSALYDTLFVAADSVALEYPRLFDLQIPLPHNYTDSQLVSVYVGDPQGYANIDSAWINWFFVDNPVPSEHSLLYDDGTHGDEVSGDSRFSALIIPDSGVFAIGQHFVSLFAADIDGHQSNQLDSTFTTVGNPTLSNAIGPDSLQRGSLDPAFIFIDAYDPDGLGDIDSVYFIVTRPNGSSNGIHFPMYDDGTSGDSVAGDGTYSTGIQAPDSSSQLGDYIFRFYSFDLEGNNSNNPEIIITAYDP